MPKKIDYRYSHKKKTKIIGRLVVFLLVLFLLAGGGGTIWFLYIIRNLPDPMGISQVKFAESTKIYDRTGKTLLYEIHGEENRTIIPSKNISQYLKDATIVAEDFNFYEHSGLDFKSIARAFIVDLLNKRISQGGSTITQQLIKNAFLKSEKTVTRKIKEAVLAIKIEKKYTKGEIFEFYLNQIPYGSNAYGAESAAQTFFDKHAGDLTLNEATLLAALPKAPSHYSPYGQYKNELINRKNWILERMFKLGFVKQEEFENAKNDELMFKKQTANILAPHFVMYVKDYLESKYGANFVEKGGLKVYTTLDYELQQNAEEVVSKIAAENEKKYGAKNAALTAVDPKTGQILVMVGSRDYFDVENDGNFNVATSKNRQPGSAFKPFAYAELFKKGYPPETVLFDVPTEFSTNPEESYKPENYDDKFRGPIAVKSALAQSLNVPSVKALYLAGIEDTIKLAEEMGISTLKDRSRFGLSLVLGGGEVVPLEMASAYSVFANDGVRNETSFILKIENGNGNIIEKWNKKSKKVFDENIARTMNDILSDNDLRAPVFGEKSYLFFDGIDVAAKTGTTQKYRDAWVVGYTPYISATVWVGNNNGAPMKKGGAGIAAAGPIFHEFMKKIIEKNGVNEKFTFPNPITNSKPMLNGNYMGSVSAKIDNDSKKLATSKTPPYKVKEVLFQQVHNILHYVDKNNPLGDIPINLENEYQYNNWENAAQKWISENNTFLTIQELVPTEYDDIHTEENAPKINISSLINYQDISNIRNINAQTDIISKFKIKEVDFYIDGELVESDFNYPYQAYINTDNILKGEHTLMVNISDQYDNTRSQSIIIVK